MNHLTLQIPLMESTARLKPLIHINNLIQRCLSHNQP